MNLYTWGAARVENEVETLFQNFCSLWNAAWAHNDVFLKIKICKFTLIEFFFLNKNDLIEILGNDLGEHV